MTQLDLLSTKRNEILALAQKHGVKKISIFGSVAKGEAHSSSDIDFLVEMKDGRTLLDLGALQIELQELLGVEVDVVTPNGLRPRIRDQVLGDARPI
jgi:uncharacterized protein